MTRLRRKHGLSAAIVPGLLLGLASAAGLSVAGTPARSSEHAAESAAAREPSGDSVTMSAAARRAKVDTADTRAARRALLEEINRDARDTAGSTGRARFDAEVMAALGRVPRHAFVPADLAKHAYENRPLPIGHGQTISQPYIVALMTDLLDLEPTSRVLEIGTGSAYQAAVLAELVDKVYTIEIVEPLADAARARMQRLGYDNVELRHADGWYGWPEAAPFDAIIVTAAANAIPPRLIEQLEPGGVLVIPVGAPFMTQHLVRVDKAEDGALSVRRILPVRFVPLTGERD